MIRGFCDRSRWPQSNPPSKQACCYHPCHLATARLQRLARQVCRLVGVTAFVTLLIILPGENPATELRGNLATWRALAGKDLRTRRLAGRATAYDRRFFEAVLAARDSLPRGTEGVALYAPGIPEWGGGYLAVYSFAPIPVVRAPPRVPSKWVAVTYGASEPQDLRLLRRLPGGALLAPAP